MPVVLLLAGCSSEDVTAPQTQTREGSYDVMLAMTMGDTRAVTDLAGSAEENAYNEKRLFVGTYDEQGGLKHWLYQAGKCNPDSALKVRYYLPTWGPTIAANLPFYGDHEHPNAGYKDKTFYVGAFSIPEKMSFPSLSLAGLDDDHNNTLNWPGVAETNYVWKPVSDKNGQDHIPMAGVKKIETSLMGKYNTDINQISPFRLPDIYMTRAMAKIIIVDVDNIIETATLQVPEKGKLVPYLPAVLDPSVPMQPSEPAGKRKLLDQKLTASNATIDGQKCFVFYSYEWSFFETDSNGNPILRDGKPVVKEADDVARKIITLTANDASGLKNTTRATTKVSFAPHTGGFPGGVSDISTADDGLWQGVMRNSVYTFKVVKPSAGGFHVTVEATPWKKADRETFEF